MLPGAPSRLPPSYPLRRALGYAHPGEPLGAWVRSVRWSLHLRAGGCALLVATDLGYLLRRCRQVLLRVEQRPAVLTADTLIEWRTLQIVVGTPFLPPPHVARGIFPGLSLAHGRLSLRLGLDAPEAALAACAAARLPVSASWIEYRAVGSG